MRQLAVGEFDRAVIGVGTDLEASILSASITLGLGVTNVWAKAISKAHARILTQIGVHHVVRPEHDMGKRVAHLVQGRMLDYIEFDDGYAFVKTAAPSTLRGRSLAGYGVRQEYGVTVVGVKPHGKEFTYATPSTVLREGDEIIVSGPRRAVEAFSSPPTPRRSVSSADLAVPVGVEVPGRVLGRRVLQVVPTDRVALPGHQSASPRRSRPRARGARCCAAAGSRVARRGVAPSGSRPRCAARRRGSRSAPRRARRRRCVRTAASKRAGTPRRSRRRASGGRGRPPATWRRCRCSRRWRRGRCASRSRPPRSPPGPRARTGVRPLSSAVGAAVWCVRTRLET